MIRKHFSIFILLIYSFLGLVFVSWSADNVVRAVRHAVYYLSFPWMDPPLAALDRLGDFGRNLGRLISLDKTFRSLEERGLLLKVSRLRHEALEAENKRLTALLGLAPLPRFKPLAARVWGRETTAGFHSLRIRRGERDGVRPADPVIVLAGEREAVVGQVAEVFADTSRVMLLTDPSSAVSAVNPRTGEQGEAEGAGPSRVLLNYLFPDTEVRAGDDVTTAGLGGIFPAGLWIGTVESLEPAGMESFRRAAVRPAARIDRISEVLVLLRADGEAAP